MSNKNITKVVKNAKIDRRTGVIPSASHSNKATRLLEKYTSRFIVAEIQIHFQTLKRIQKREPTMQTVLDKLEKFDYSNLVETR